MSRTLFRIAAYALTALAAWPQAPVDADDDGVPDAWENDKVEVTYADGTKEKLDLKGMGASATHKDVFVWITWMDAPGHSHRPTPETLAPVRQAFANAPVSNPDGQTGVRLHLLYAKKALAHVNSLGSITGQPPGYDWAALQKLKDSSLPKPLDSVFRFCLFAHFVTGMGTSSGLSRGIGAYDFIVSLGGFPPNFVGTAQDQAGTFMHELGHNLGLRHGGVDHVQFKPNYLSVMNYSFQLDGLIIDGEPAHFDYSRVALPPLAESQLDRTKGLSADPAHSRFGSQIYCGCQTGLSEPILSITKPVDWDCSGRAPSSIPTVVSRDVNRECEITSLSSQDDWPHIKFKDYPGAANPPGVTPLSGELTFAMARGIVVPPVTGVRGEAQAEQVIVTWRPIPLDRVLAYRIYRQEGNSAEVRIGSTDRNMFADRTAVRGRPYRYFIRALFAGRGAAIVDLISLDPNRKNEFRTFVSPTASREYAMLGVEASGVGPEWTAPDVLYQGPASESVVVTP